MLGILVQLALSWLILWLFQKKNLRVLGFYPAQKRLAYFALLFVITALFCASGFFMKMLFAKQQWTLNPALTVQLVWEGIWWNLKSVLFEELIFRGAIFYVLLKRIGQGKAILVSAIGFGIYHWFSFGILGNPAQMVIVFFVTGSMGLLLAYGYAKSLSLLIPIAIHFGWNYTQQAIFSSGPIGKQLFIPAIPHAAMNVSYFVFFSILLLPMISMLLINYWIIRNMEQVGE